MSQPPPEEQSGGLGCYGLALQGVDQAADLLRSVPSDAPALRVVLADAPSPGLPPTAEQERFGPDAARFHLPGGGHVEVDRTTSTATFSFPNLGPVDHHHLVHPFMATSCATVSRWHGRDVFHAGSFVVDGQAWGVLGDKGRGKSTLMAWLASRDVPVLADDLLVLDGERVLRGPRCLDLRTDAALALGVGEDLGVVGARARARVPLSEAPPSAPLAGWVLPEWGEKVACQAVPVAERLARLHGNQALRVPTADAARFFRYAGLPTLALSRPRDWRTADAAGDALLDAVTHT